MKLRLGLLFCVVILLNSNRGLAEEAFPKRIVSLSPVITEEIFLMGAGDLLVGRTHYCTRPAEAEKIEEIGNVIEVSVEKIVALRPDLVFATPMMDPRAKEKLKSLGIPITEFPAAIDFNGVCDSFLRLGKILGKEKEAEDIIRRAKLRTAELRRQVDGKVKPSVFLELGADPLVTITKESFLSDLIESAGGVNVAREAKRPLYSREKVLANNPDVIIIVSMGYDGKKEKQTWQSFGDLKAVKQGQIRIVDSNLFCAPTPLSYATALNEMIKILHPNEK